MSAVTEALSRTDRLLRLLAWPAAIWIAYELLWYEQYKLTGNEGSVYLFTILSDWLGTPGGEKPFRLFVAILEIFCAVLVLIPRTRMIGAALSMGTMGGAIFFHTVSPLGIDPYGDGGQLFKEAVFTFLMAAFVLFAHRAEAFALLVTLRGRLLPAGA
jgi:uncharacterized membrane protein YphA (DoxX/SURF4 family)